MPYIVFSPPPKPTVQQESVSTMGRQLWDGIKHCFHGENWTDNDANNANYLKSKRKYFDELFTLSPALKNKLVSWCKQVPDAVCMSPSALNKHLSASNTQHQTYYDPNYGGRSVDMVMRTELAMQQKARVTNGRNSLTYATCSYILDAGKNQAYLLFFTFDSDGIDVCQVLTKNEYATGGRVSGFDFVKLPQWNSVPASEYKK